MADVPEIRIARVHDEPYRRNEGVRLLVDRIWPRGMSKAKLQYDAWLRQVAPSSDLRKWFGHDPARWGAFQRRYIAELDTNPEAIETCLDWCASGPVTLLYSAADRDHNQAVVLRDYLRRRLAHQGQHS